MVAVSVWLMACAGLQFELSRSLTRLKQRHSLNNRKTNPVASVLYARISVLTCVVAPDNKALILKGARLVGPVINQVFHGY